MHGTGATPDSQESLANRAATDHAFRLANLRTPEDTNAEAVPDRGRS